ncbi:hypothetical protein CRE_06957 [Caenorhabditis remanei]|uniref:Integrase catalytic domain-containing protein n=1 Tax=Caenorhabditis remanei TaxID=31234 RepID=E3N6M2_CAERE|nr:hypothetical protein CRE_06957 [Caenorhabditis remanei]
MKLDIIDMIRHCVNANNRKPRLIERRSQWDQPNSSIIQHNADTPVTSDHYQSQPTETNSSCFEILAETTAEELIKLIVSVHGSSESITTDCGPAFKAQLLEKTMQSLGIKQQKSMAFHLQSYGMIGRSNRTLEECLSTYVNRTQSDCDDFLPLVTFAINTAPSSATKISPFEAVFGLYQKTTCYLLIHCLGSSTRQNVNFVSRIFGTSLFINWMTN